MENVRYSNAIGSLMYLMVCTRPDLAHVVSLVSKFMSNPKKPHWDVLEWILRYVRGTSTLVVSYKKDKKMADYVKGFVDAD